MPMLLLGCRRSLHPPRCPQDPPKGLISLCFGKFCPKPGHNVRPGHCAQQRGTCCFNSQPGGSGGSVLKANWAKIILIIQSQGPSEEPCAPAPPPGPACPSVAQAGVPPRHAAGSVRLRCCCALTHGVSHSGWGLCFIFE